MPKQHDAETVETARQLAAGGFNANQIRRILCANGTEVGWDSVKRWIDPEYRERRNHASKGSMRRSYARQPRRTDYVLRQARRMRDRGMSYEAISIAIDIYHARTITADSLRYMFRLQNEATEVSS